MFLEFLVFREREKSKIDKKKVFDKIHLSSGGSFLEYFLFCFFGRFRLRWGGSKGHLTSLNPPFFAFIFSFFGGKGGFGLARFRGRWGPKDPTSPNPPFFVLGVFFFKTPKSYFLAISNLFCFFFWQNLFSKSFLCFFVLFVPFQDSFFAFLFPRTTPFKKPCCPFLSFFLNLCFLLFHLLACFLLLSFKEANWNIPFWNPSCSHFCVVFCFVLFFLSTLRVAAKRVF